MIKLMPYITVIDESALKNSHRMDESAPQARLESRKEIRGRLPGQTQSYHRRGQQRLPHKAQQRQCRFGV
jgi:hypothetical protein